MKKIIYQLSIEDVQNVAEEEIGRTLIAQEISLLEERIAEKIAWYEIIAQSIDEILLADKS